jgi:hypothetical protein
VELNAGTGLPSKIVVKDKGKQPWIVVYKLPSYDCRITPESK